jgi:hypothetical protein
MAPYASPRRSAEIAAIYRRHLGLGKDGPRFTRHSRLSAELSWAQLARALRGHRFDDTFAGLQQFIEEPLK